MYRLTAKISISGEKTWELDKVTGVEITRDIEQLTDVCRITIPKKIKWNGESEIPVRRGDSVRVWLGYDDDLQPAFAGYVREVGYKTPVVIECEDEMYRLKQMPAKKTSYENVDIETLLRDQGLGDYRINVLGEQNIGKYRVEADTVAALLVNLQETGIRSFFRQEDGTPVLYCGVLFDMEETKPSQVFETGVNIIEDSGLGQQKAEDIKIKVKAVSTLADNTDIEIEVGDDDGEPRMLHTSGKEEPELRAWAEQELDRLKRDGLTGNFTTFGYRLVDKLDVIGIKIDGERKGVYQVNKNEIKYGESGFRQEITLGKMVSE